MSPLFFNIYVDDLLIQLESNNNGCRVMLVANLLVA